ncbi:MAG: hypothetical protein NT178_00505 [Proteobacteria bacterium]|nr:hypothetical protein [Pseudomonadota bacterium]
MKIKHIYLFLLFFLIILIFTNRTFSEELVKGAIIATPQDVLSVGTGEKIITNLGKKDGLIIGDILKIVESDDDILIGNIGKCAVIKTEDSTSVCEVIKLSAEAGKGDYVYINKLEYEDHQIYPVSFRLLNEIIAPYEPQKNIRVYIHNIYDEKNNITKFSEKIKEEIASVFKQKKRMTVDTASLINYINYQDHYFNSDTDKPKKESIDILKNSMKRFDIDVLITGVYTKKNDKIYLKFYIVDRKWQDRTTYSILNAQGYLNALAETIIPYEPFKEKELVKYSIMLYEKDCLPDKDEQRAIIKYESEKELKFKYKFEDGKSKFNRINPGDLTLKVNREDIGGIQKGVELEKYFEKGKKRIFVSFVPTLSYNEDEIIQLKKEIKKEIILDLKDEDNISIEMKLDATYEKEKIDIKIVRKKVKEPIILKSVTSETDRKPAIELYQD